MNGTEAKQEMKTLAGEIRALADKANDEAQEWTSGDEAAWAEKNARYDRAAVVAKADPPPRPIGLEDRVGWDGLGADPNAQRTTTGPAECLRDAHSGRIVPMFAPGDSMHDHLRKSNPTAAAEYGDLEAGDVVRALAVGASSEQERRSLSEGIDSAGGFSVPSILSAQLIDQMRTKARVVQAGARSIALDSDRHAFAKLLSDPTPGWRGELDSVDADDPTFGEVVFQPKSLAVLVRMSEELIQDSVNAGVAVQTAITNALALEVDRVALFGDSGSGEPVGLNSTANVNSVSMGTNGAAVTDYTDILDAIEDILEDNGGTPTAAIMAPRTWRVYAGMTDSTGQPLRRPDAIASLPFLETTQVPIDQVQGSASNASTILTGDFSQMVLGYRQKLRIEVLRERYRDTLEIGFLAHLRVDMQVWHPQAFAKIVGIIPA